MTTEQSPEWLIENADHGIAFEVACASALQRLLTENASLQQQLEAIGAGGVGALMPVASSPEIPDSSDRIEQQLDMAPVAEIRNGVLRWYFSSPKASTPKCLLRGVHPLYTRQQPQERSHGIGGAA